MDEDKYSSLRRQYPNTSMVGNENCTMWYDESGKVLGIRPSNPTRGRVDVKAIGLRWDPDEGRAMPVLEKSFLGRMPEDLRSALAEITDFNSDSRNV